MMCNRYTGLSKFVLTCLALTSISAPALAQHNREYPLDVEILDSTATPLTTNLRQTTTVQHMIVNVGRKDAGLDPQPEMICPTAKSPTIQEWSSQSLPKIASHPVVSHRVAATKPQVVAHQNVEAVSHGTPVSIASAYPFNTGSRSYSIASKANSHHSALR